MGWVSEFAEFIRWIAGGVGVGLVLSFLAGPVFVLLVYTSIYRGAKDAVLFASGVWLSDLFIAFFIELGLGSWLEAKAHEPVWHSVTAIVLLGAGTFIVWRTRRASLLAVGRRLRLGRKPSLTARVLTPAAGFLFNISNPGIILFWATVIGASSHLMTGKGQAVPLAFIGGVIGGMAVSDLLKIVLARRFSGFLTVRRLRVLNLLIGFAAIIAGGSILLRAIIMA